MKKVFVLIVKNSETHEIEWVEAYDNLEKLEEATDLVEYDGDFNAEMYPVKVNHCEIG